MTVIARWYVCENCGRIGPMSDFQEECRPGWTHGRLLDVDRESPALATTQGAVEALDLARGTLKRVAEGCEEPAFGAAMCLGAIDHLTAGRQYAEKEGSAQPRWVVGGCYEENRLRLIEGRALGMHEQLTLVEASE